VWYRDVTDTDDPWEDYEVYKRKQPDESSVLTDEPCIYADTSEYFQRMEHIKKNSVSLWSKQEVEHTPDRWWNTEITESKRRSLMDKKKMTEALCSELGLTEFQKRRATGIMLGLNLDRFGSQKRISKVALAVIKYVVEKDRSERYSEEWIEDPSDLRISNNEDYVRLVEKEGLEMNDMMRLSIKVKKKISELNESDSLFI